MACYDFCRYEQCRFLFYAWNSKRIAAIAFCPDLISRKNISAILTLQTLLYRGKKCARRAVADLACVEGSAHFSCIVPDRNDFHICLA